MGGSQAFQNGVSKNFRADWNFAISVSRITSVASIATIFSLAAIVTDFQKFQKLGNVAVVCFAAAIGLYVVAFAIIKFRAPPFLQDNPNYKAFEDQKHSHRWILWLFYESISTYSGGASILHESIEKKLSLDISQLTGLPSNFSGESVKKSFDNTAGAQGSNIITLEAFKPQNHERDLYMFFTVAGPGAASIKQYFLPIKEDDPELDAKMRELFWIIFTEAAKTNPVSKFFAWGALYVSMAFTIGFFLAAVWSVGTSPKALDKPDATVNFVTMTVPADRTTGLVTEAGSEHKPSETPVNSAEASESYVAEAPSTVASSLNSAH